MLACKQIINHGGVPLVLIHGYLGGRRFFVPNINAFNADIDVITVDLPGFGDSHAVAGVDSIHAMAEQVLQQLSAIKCEQFYLLGHSMGGMVALQMALLAPSRVLKLIPFATNSDGKLSERFETFAASKIRMQERGIDDTRKSIVATWFCDGAANQYFNACLECSNNTSLQTAVAALDAMERFDISAQIHTITCPTFIIGAQLDRTYAPHRLEAMRTIIPNAELYVMRGCAHNAHLEDQETFNRLVLTFVKSD